MLPSTSGSPAHAWRMKWRIEWVRTIPTGRDWTLITRNLRSFVPLLVDFADADGTNRKAPGQALIAQNIGCDRRTIPDLYGATEASGLITCSRTPMGRIKAYALMPQLPGWTPDWDAARVVLDGSRHLIYKRKNGAT